MALCIMSKCGCVCVGGSGAGGVEERERHYGFMHNVEMWVRTCVCGGGAGGV